MLLEHDFGEEVAPHHADNLACAARVFGIDPSTATRAGQVLTVYAWTYCEERLTGGFLGDQVSMPVAIHLAGPSIETPSVGDAYPASIAGTFPRGLRQTATDEPPYMEDLVRQVAATRPRPSPEHT